MLVDEAGIFITQRVCPEMAMLQTEISGENLVVFHKKQPGDSLKLLLDPVPENTVRVKVWADECIAWHISHADAWFTSKLSRPCRLVYMPATTKRLVDRQYAFDNEITGFADAFPLLMIGQESLNDLNSRLSETLPMDRFRPNIVFEGGLPYEEDTMAAFSINQMDFFGVKPCSRCVITTINQQTAEKSHEPLKIMSTYRMINNKLYFGQNVLHKGWGIIKIGDPIEIKKTKAHVIFNQQQQA
jgi:hypothetical protein